MVDENNRQAFLILTTRVSKRNIRFYHKINKAAAKFGDVFLLCHTNDGASILQRTSGVKIKTFTNDVLKDLGYIPVMNTLIPGSNHYAILNFFLHHSEYKNYWCIEDDVRLRGKWSKLFEKISIKENYDFVSSHFRRYEDEPDWSWWPKLHDPLKYIDKEDLLCSFNPIYRISNKALKHIDEFLKKGFVGHHELLMATLLKKGGFKLAGFNVEKNNVTSSLGYCTQDTMRWRPVHFIKGFRRNKLYHPVKENITKKQIVQYIAMKWGNKKTVT